MSLNIVGLTSILEALMFMHLYLIAGTINCSIVALFHELFSCGKNRKGPWEKFP